MCSSVRVFIGMFVYVFVCVLVPVASDVFICVQGFVLSSFTYSLCGFDFDVLVFFSPFACLLFAYVFVCVFVFVYVVFVCSCSFASSFTFPFSVRMFIYVFGAV